MTRDIFAAGFGLRGPAGLKGEKGDTGTVTPEALAAKTSAEAARDGALSAKTATETARDASVTAKTAAETARDAAVAARVGAEAVGTTNDTVIAGRINTPGSATATALSASIGGAVSALPTPPADLVVLGDSISAGGQVDPVEGRVIPASDLVSEYLGISVWNPSVPGERMGDIALRQGGLAAAFTVPGGVIPAGTTAFAVTLVSPPPDGGGSQFAGDGTGNADADSDVRSHFVGTFLGVTVRAWYTNVAWFMARVAADPNNTSKPVPTAGGFFRTVDGRSRRGAVLFSFGGRNGGDLIARTREMVQNLAEPRRFILSNPLTSQDDINATYPATQAAALTTLASGYAQGHYFDMRGHLIANGLAEEGITPTSGDLTDIANNTVPRSLRVDAQHPNAAGQRVIGRKLAQLGVDYGWFPAESLRIPGRRRGVNIPAGSTQVAYRAAPTPLQNATKWSMRLVWRASALGDEVIAVRDTYNVNSGKVPWQLQTSGANLIFQVFGAINFGSGTTFTFTKPPFVADVDYGLRLDWDAATGVTLYSSVDGGLNWTQRQVITATSSLFVTPDPQVQIKVTGLVRSFKMIDGATTYISQDFTTVSAEDANWVLQNGAVYV